MSFSRVAVVTGASRGIGRAIAIRLAEDGYVVGVHYGSGLQEAERTVAMVGARGGRAFAFQANLATRDVGRTFWESWRDAGATSGFGDLPLHALVNNAGVTLRGSIEDLSISDFDLQYAVNAAAPYSIVKAGLSVIVDGGRIVNISSGVTRIAFPEIIAYSMTKGAIDAFTFTLAKHLGPRGITVNAVAPGVIDTDINAHWLRGNEAAIRAVSDSAALGRVGRPEDVAGIVSFLVSNDGGWVTGQTIDATGGTQL